MNLCSDAVFHNFRWYPVVRVEDGGLFVVPWGVQGKSLAAEYQAYTWALTKTKDRGHVFFGATIRRPRHFDTGAI